MGGFGNFIDETGVTRLRASGGGGGSMPLQSVTVTLQPADILALNTVPFELVPTPGPGKAVVPLSVIPASPAAQFGPSTSYFLAAGIYLGSDGLQNLLPLPSCAQVLSAADTVLGVDVMYSSGSATTFIGPADTPWVLYAAAADPQGGDSPFPLQVTTVYTVVDFVTP